MPFSMAELQQRIKDELAAIPDFITMKAVLSMKQRCKKLIEVEGSTFEGQKISI